MTVKQVCFQESYEAAQGYSTGDQTVLLRPPFIFILLPIQLLSGVVFSLNTKQPKIRKLWTCNYQISSLILRTDIQGSLRKCFHAVVCL